MTDNLDDFDQEPEQHENGNGEHLLPPAAGITGRLKTAWNSQPLFKLLVLMTAVGAVIAVSITLFSGSNAPTEVSKLVKPPSLNEPAGGPASPYFVQQTKEAEAQRTQQAIQTGGSALPTPIGQSTNLDELNGDKSKKDPLVELRAETEHLKQQLAQVQQQRQMQVQQAQPQKQEQFDDSLAQAMQRQMQQLMEGWTPHGEKDVVVTKVEEKKGGDTLANGDHANEGAGAAGAAQSLPPARTIVPAGTVSYAQLLTEANSDVPGPILAQIVSGPLNGGRAVGEFKVMDDYLVLHFSLADVKGKDYPIDAYALDPDTTLGGMATEVDERWLTRVLLPAAAGFMEGFGSALAAGSSSVVENGTTTIVQQSGKGFQQGMYQGLSQAGQTMSQFFMNQANNTKPLVRVAAGAPMGLFFVSSVLDRTVSQYPAGYPYGAAAGGGYQGGPGYGGQGGQLPAGYYPGSNMPGGVNGYGSPAGYNYGAGQNASGVSYPTATGVPYPASMMNPSSGVNTGYQTYPNSNIPVYSNVGMAPVTH